MLNKISIQLASSMKVNQWKKSDSVINSFKNIPEKWCSLIVFDIENFYASISLDVFSKALQFAKSFCKITDEEISVIMPVRKTLLFNINKPWVKKSRNKHFGVPFGCFDDAEVSEIAETNILSKIRL